MIRSGARFVVPYESADEAALVGQVPIYPAKTLLQVVEHLRADSGEADARRIDVHQAMVRLTPPTYPDMFDVKGQLAARRALEIAAAGGQRAAGRPAGHRQDDAGAAVRGNSAADDD